MISYYQYGKGSFTACEDSLISGVIDTLKYLPPEIFWYILKKSCIKDNLPNVSGPMQSINFWTKWNAKNTNNSKFVEPDVFIRYVDFDLIIEAKRYDKNMQKEYQIEDEIQAYKNVYGEEKKPLFLIQLGGNKVGFDPKDNLDVAASVKIRWMDLLSVVHDINDKISDSYLPGQVSQKFILEDVINAMELHGFFKLPWLEEMEMPKINLEIINNDNFFQWIKKHS